LSRWTLDFDGGETPFVEQVCLLGLPSGAAGTDVGLMCSLWVSAQLVHQHHNASLISPQTRTDETEENHTKVV
jgi:hypothetical protein